MSCWMVDHNTINQIVEFIRQTDAYGAPYQWRERMQRQHDRYQCGPWDIEHGRRDRWAELGYEMWMMNRAGVEKCYSHRDDVADMIGEPYIYEMVRPPGPIDAHKLLTCFLYQCTEGDVDKLELYANLRETQQSIGYGIISHLPEWNAAECWR